MFEELYRYVVRRVEADRAFSRRRSRAREWARICVKYGIFPRMLPHCRLDGGALIYDKRGRRRRIPLDPEDRERLESLGLPPPHAARAISIHASSLLPAGLRIVDIKIIRQVLGLEPPSTLTVDLAALKRINAAYRILLKPSPVARELRRPR